MRHQVVEVPRLVALALVSLALCASCSDEEVESRSDFDTPGLVAAANGKLFVANLGEDALQVLTIDANDPSQIKPVMSPNQYFPLRIPLATRPLAMAASHDERFVMVLSAAAGEVVVVESETLTVAENAAGKIALQLGDGALSLVASPVACTSPCAARVFVGFSDDRGVLELVLEEDEANDKALSLRAGRAYRSDPPLMGHLGYLAISGDARYLFASDTESQNVHRIDLERGGIDAENVGSWASTLR